MALHAAPPTVVRFPPRPTGGITPGKPHVSSAVASIPRPKTRGGFALDALLSSGAINDREHAAGLAYRALRARFERAARAMRSTRNGGGALLPEAEWFALKRRHAALIRVAGAERFALDRLLLDDDGPLGCEVGRVAEALGRVAKAHGGLHTIAE